MEIKLEAEKRVETGKGPAKRLRAEGQVPAVLYGTGIEPSPLKVKREELRDVLHSEMGSNVLINLSVVDGGKHEEHLVMVKELQRHPLREAMLHVDFVTVARDEKVTTRVNIAIEGGDRSVGLKAGGTLQHVLWEVEVECLPADMPEHMVADISGLDVGENLRVSDLIGQPGVTVLNDPDDPILNILAPRLAEELEEEKFEVAGEIEPGVETPAVDSEGPAGGE